MEVAVVCACEDSRVFLRFRFGVRKEILRNRLEEFERPFSIDVISGHYILRDRWRNLRDRFGPSKHLKKTLEDSTKTLWHSFWDPMDLFTMENPLITTALVVNTSSLNRFKVPKIPQGNAITDNSVQRTCY